MRNRYFAGHFLLFLRHSAAQSSQLHVIASTLTNGYFPAGSQQYVFLQENISLPLFRISAKWGACKIFRTPRATPPRPSPLLRFPPHYSRQHSLASYPHSALDPCSYGVIASTSLCSSYARTLATPSLRGTRLRTLPAMNFRERALHLLFRR